MAAGLVHPSRAFLIPHGNRIPGGSPPFYHHNPTNSYTYPPPLPSQYHVPSSSTFQGRAGLSSSFPIVRRPGGGSRAPDENRKGDDGDDSEQTREVMSLDHVQEIHLDRYLTPQPRPVPFPSFFPRDVTGSRENSPYPYCEFLIVFEKINRLRIPLSQISYDITHFPLSDGRNAVTLDPLVIDMYQERYQMIAQFRGHPRILFLQLELLCGRSGKSTPTESRNRPRTVCLTRHRTFCV